MTSCKDAPTEVSESISTIWPIEIHTSWTYTTTEYDSTGKSIDSSSHMMIFAKDTIIHNEKWYELLNSNLFFKNRSDGLYWCGVTDSNREYLYLPFPVTRMQEITTKIFTFSVLSIDSVINNYGTDVKCVVYKRIWNSSEDKSSYSIEFYKPNFGPVQTNDYRTTVSGMRYLQSQTLYKRSN